MSDYDFRPGGSLKLKGVAEGGIVKKKKKKSKAPKHDPEPELVQEPPSSKDRTKSPDSERGSGRNSPATTATNNGNSASSSRKTEAERRFEEVQRRRLAERVSKLARKTHKDRVNEFNTQLESLSEHHDIPKVGPG